MKDFRIVEITFLNGNLYCGINNGIVLALKRLTLTPLLIFNAHMHRLHTLCPLTFETRLTIVRKQHPNRNNIIGDSTLNKNISTQYSTTTVAKKVQSVLVSLGRALPPLHEDIYLSSTNYRVDALRKYGNCLILCSWSS
jgi:hypothetical protein